ncbi:MAG: universal stress protein [Anaerolineales bacterium]|nr:universal stress protein [Anaerolineales bacterium]
MNAGDFQLLLCTNGYETTRPALDYGVWLASLLGRPVLLLGVVEHADELASVESLLRETGERLEALGIPARSQIDYGRGSLVIARQAQAGRYLSVVGPLGRPVWRRYLQGRSFRRLLSRIETPIVYVRQASGLPLRRVLVCVGGLDYSRSIARLCLYLARAVGAEMTVLHVVELVTLEYPLARAVHEHWQDIIETDTPQGRNLKGIMQEIQSAGLRVTLKVRQGNPVHEILDEAQRGAYDLVGLGSPYSAHSLRHIYMPNVTAEVAEALGKPVLTVRLGHELIAQESLDKA